MDNFSNHIGKAVQALEKNLDKSNKSNADKAMSTNTLTTAVTTLIKQAGQI
jgi:hypothetical protein